MKSRLSSPGLRCEEPAQLAGVSAAYYTRFEQCDARDVSREVPDMISRVLKLSDAEHAHLLRLAEPSGISRSPSHRANR